MTDYRSLIDGGFFSDDPSNMAIRRSIRTNNPGALNTASWTRAFPGFVGEQNDSENNNTAIFEAPEYGVAAWWTLMDRYRKQYRPENFHLKNVLTRYSGGNTEVATRYIAFVSAKAGIGSKVPLDINDDFAMRKIATAFFHYEAGEPTPLSAAQISFGIEIGQNGGNVPAEGMQVSNQPTTAGSRQRFIEIAVSEAKTEISWDDAQSEAEKYLKPLRAPMRALGHIGSKPVFYDWCAAFVTWCARKAGYRIPDQPLDFWATMALVESWREWGKQTGYGSRVSEIDDLEPGDIVLFEWFDGDKALDHIGVFIKKKDEKPITAEGNKKNKAFYGKRKIANIKYRVRLPDNELS